MLSRSPAETAVLARGPTFRTYLLPFAAALLAMLVLDGLWLGLVATDMYSREMGSLLAATPRWGAAALFYLGYNALLVYFSDAVAQPARAMRCMARGAALGVMGYGTYDLTNLAVIEGWPVALSAIDIVWGAALSAVVAGAAHATARWQARR